MLEIWHSQQSPLNGIVPTAILPILHTHIHMQKKTRLHYLASFQWKIRMNSLEILKFIRFVH